MEPCHFRLETHSAAQTQGLGAELARLLDEVPGAIIALTGDLGAGKTTFTQGLAQGLGIGAAVTSPTFVLINRYVGADGRVLQHADCYRLSNAPAEMWDVGLVDMFAEDEIVVVEWADRIPGLFPDDYLEIAFAYWTKTGGRFASRRTGRAMPPCWRSSPPGLGKRSARRLNSLCC